MCQAFSYNDEKQRIHTEFWWGNLLENVYLENQEGDGRVASRWIVGKDRSCVELLRIVSRGEPEYLGSATELV
jgi:hypothetical protein